MASHNEMIQMVELFDMMHVMDLGDEVNLVAHYVAKVSCGSGTHLATSRRTVRPFPPPFFPKQALLNTDHNPQILSNIARLADRYYVSLIDFHNDTRHI